MSKLQKRNTALSNVHKVFHPILDAPPEKKNILFFSPNHYSTKYKLGGFSGCLKPPKSKVNLPPIKNHNINTFKSSTKVTSFSNKNLNEISLFTNNSNFNTKPYYSISNTKENIIKRVNKGSVNMKVSSNNLHNISSNNNNSGDILLNQNNNNNIVSVSNINNGNNLLKKRKKNLTSFNNIGLNANSNNSLTNVTRNGLKTNNTLNNSPLKEGTEHKPTLSYISKPVRTKMSFNENIIFPHKKLLSLSPPMLKEKNKSNNNLNNKDDSNTILKTVSSFINHFEISQNGKDNQGKVKTNQDSYVMIPSLLDINDVLIYGVMDGHGVNGHFASKYVKDFIIEYFTNRTIYTSTQKEIDANIIYKKLTKNNYALLTNFSNNVHDNIINKVKFDCHFSGTTMNLIFQIGTKLICCNVGDSRSVVISFHPYDDIQYKVEDFSVDHKPENNIEYNRIISKGGEIYPFADEIVAEGSKRIWVKNEKFPGIAISRTIGDLVAHTVGVIATPDYKEKDIVNDNICIVISASDGVWEFLTNEDVKDIVIPFYIKNDVKGAVNEIVRKASLKWKEEGLKMDDITCVVVFLNKQK